MKELTSKITSTADLAKNALLQKFVEEQGSADYSLQTSGADFVAPSDPTTPTSYNNAITDAIITMGGIFHEIDTIGAYYTSMKSVLDSEMATIEKKISVLHEELKNASISNTISARYKSMVNVVFDSNKNYQLLPAGISALTVDPVTKNLTRPILLDTSKIHSTINEQMCTVTVDEMLGISVEPRHPIEETIDGNTDTYWQEVILSDVPIKADSGNKNLAWLTERYKSGAAVRLRFDFESITPISDIVINQLADYPVEVLDINYASYSNRSFDPVWYKLFDGDFDKVGTNGSLATGTGSPWKTSDGAGLSSSTDLLPNPCSKTGGPLVDGSNLRYFEVRFNTTADRRFLTLYQDEVTIEAGAVYELEFYARSTGGAGSILAEIKGRENRGTAEEPDYYFKDIISTTISGTTTGRLVLTSSWKKYSFLFMTPNNLDSGDTKVSFSFLDGYQMCITHVGIHKFLTHSVPAVTESDGNKLTIQLYNETGKTIMCKSLWLTLGQRHYKLRPITINKGEVISNNLWATTLGNSSASNSLSSKWRTDDSSVISSVENRSNFFSLTKKLGTLLKSLLASLITISGNGDQQVKISKYEYTIGAYEIDIRYKDFYTSGGWVSDSINPVGELRQLTVLPTMSDIEAEKVHFYVIPKKNYPVDTVNMIELNKLNKYSVFFACNDEEATLPTDTTTSVTMPVAHKTDLFNTTTRFGKVSLSEYPYFNNTKVNNLLDVITNTSSANGVDSDNERNYFDPNTSTYAYLSGGEVQTITGYNPVKVTISYKGIDGRTVVIPPDSLGVCRYTKYTNVADTPIQVDAANAASTTGEYWNTNKPIAWIPGVGPRLTMYWQNIITEDLTPIEPSRYSIIWTTDTSRYVGLPPNPFGSALTTSSKIHMLPDSGYNSTEYRLIAYYRSEVDDFVETILGVYGGLRDLAIGSYPITRNKTDYLNNNPYYNLTPYDPENYPVYEYYVDTDGAIVFAQPLFDPEGTIKYSIKVEYDSLEINPRVYIQYDQSNYGTSPCSTPLVSGYRLLLNTRTV